jgi:hypothetical protein
MLPSIYPVWRWLPEDSGAEIPFTRLPEVGRAEQRAG